ncbi:MAG: DUF1570 domain-containing protein [Pirellulaceae bacterium]
MKANRCARAGRAAGGPTRETAEQFTLTGQILGWAVCLVAGWGAPQLWGTDHVSFMRDARSLQVEGKIVVEAQDGGVLLMDRAGALWAVPPEEKKSQSTDSAPFTYFNKEELAKQLTEELPPGFRIHDTAHYLIVYNTSPVYAQWCGGLFERLYNGFTNYWSKRGFELHEPETPLVALLFDGRETFNQYARRELGDATPSIIGYFSLASNRITTFDLTGADALAGGRRATSTEHVTRLLSRPEAERTVATIVHEATHQVAFNCGLQTRYADIPLWLSEGIAIYFETPDLQSSRGWSGIGKVNRVRLAEFRQYLRTRPADSLKTLLATDERFRNTRTAPPAYAESWALNYFLLRKYASQYQAYLRHQAEKKPLRYDTPEERLAQFTEIFGQGLGELDAEFLRFAVNLR